MNRQLRPRRLTRAALTVALVAVALVGAACGQHPNSIFHPRTEFNREVGFLFNILIWLGTLVFVFVEAVLIYTLVRFRRRGGPRQPEHVHGNTTLEILWTIIPAVILVFIAIPTVRVIFRTQAKARADALQVEVIGHQWWWEFRYPQYFARNPSGRIDTVVTANELYLPIGRTVSFTLKSQDVVHSFWVPSLGGKRDVVTNHANYLWFTPDSTTTTAFNGFCAEFCGASHANMRFRTFVVTTEEFQSWVAHQQTPAAFTKWKGLEGMRGGAAKRLGEAMEKLKGFPLRTKIDMKTGATPISMSNEVIDVREGTPPKDALAVPPGYAKTMPRGMPGPPPPAR